MGGVILVLIVIMVVVCFVLAENWTTTKWNNSAPSAPEMPLKKHFISTFIPPGDYTVIDTETTGLDASICEILEIGAIRYRDHIETERFHSYIRPVGPLYSGAAKVNHITFADVRNAPPFSEIYNKFIEFIGEDPLVGYNIGFDVKFIQTRSGVVLKNPCFDVLNLARRFVDTPDHKLVTVKGHFGVSSRSHTALGDCEATAAVYERILRMPDVLEALQEEQAQHEAWQESQRQYEEHRQKVLASKQELKEKGPSTTELHAISKKMQGRSGDYTKTVLQILHNRGKDTSRIKYEIFPYGSNSEALTIDGAQYFAVKLSGRLRYVLIPVSPDRLKCEFVCMPSSLQEGENSTRVYLEKPEDLEQLADVLIATYDRMIVSNFANYVT